MNNKGCIAACVSMMFLGLLVWLMGEILYGHVESPHAILPASWDIRFVSCKVTAPADGLGCWNGIFTCPTNFYWLSLLLAKNDFSVAESVRPKVKSILFTPTEIGRENEGLLTYSVPATELEDISLVAANWLAPLESRFLISLSPENIIPGVQYAVSVCLEFANTMEAWNDSELWIRFAIHKNDTLPSPGVRGQNQENSPRERTD